MGNCLTEVTKEEFEKGKTHCKAKDCVNYKEPFESLEGICCGGGCCMEKVQA